MNTVSFPGLGIGEFKIDPVAFRIPIGDGIEIRWYGLIIVTGMILAFLYCAFRSKQEGVSFDDLLDIAIFTIIFSVVGARLYYVLTSLDQYDSFLDVFEIWNGGLAIYGGVIAGALTIFIVCRIKKYKGQKILAFMDSVAPALLIGQFIGRWGNFCNGEAFGRQIAEDSPLYFARMGLISSNTISDFSTAEMVFVHPTFLYESLWNFVGFIIINALYKKKKFNGQMVLMYLSWYGFGRMFIEGLRTDSLYVGVFRISQVVGFLCFVIGGIALIYFLRRAIRQEKDSVAYERSYEKLGGDKPSAFDTSFIEENDESETENKTADESNVNTEETKDEENGEDN